MTRYSISIWDRSGYGVSTIAPPEHPLFQPDDNHMHTGHQVRWLLDWCGGLGIRVKVIVQCQRRSGRWVGFANGWPRLERALKRIAPDGVEVG